jgi:NTP pyrophosphatase (non-canonical NTP hydrolase)
MLEECGELAKALRKHVGLKIDHKRLDSYGNLSHEMADVLICLIILANKCNIDLYDALQQKEAINKQRLWQTE